MTPPRLTELRCPSCGQSTWRIDSDYRGIDGKCVPYSERQYQCSGCQHSGPGFLVKKQSPPEFFLQPHSMYPMPQKEFDHWLSILREHFPEHARLKEGNREFRPNTDMGLSDVALAYLSRWITWSRYYLNRVRRSGYGGQEPQAVDRDEAEG